MEIDDETIPEIKVEPTSVTSLTILPEKSQNLYITVYNNFMEWRAKMNINSFTESDLLQYFTELSTKFKPSTLWTHYSMLRSTLNINQGVNIENYVHLRSLLKEKSEGFHPKQANTFSSEEIKKFLTEAPDKKYLAMKVAMILGIMGSCRAIEMYGMKMENIKDLGSAFLVTLPNSKSKISRKFILTDQFYEICKKYVDLRPAHLTTQAFFLNYQNGKCNKQSIGINKFTKMGKQIAEFLKLKNPEKYSAHSFRKSSVTQRVEACLKSCMETPCVEKQSEQTENPNTSKQKHIELDVSSLPSLTIAHCSNMHITINVHK